ncbi:MAG: hypothetical protein ACR2OR_12795 [Hyphomicrobiales bacterium]
MNSAATSLKRLEEKITRATGSDAHLDRAIYGTFGQAKDVKPPPQNYTSSVDACIELIGEALPGWHWHVGYGVRGIMPYASLNQPTSSNGTDGARVEASAPTVPLALLHATIKALLGEIKD